MIAIGASTGGTEALVTLLKGLPRDAPPVAIVQHMPKGYTKQFARRLDRLCAITVREAAAGDRISSGVALLAPGDHHLHVRRSGVRYSVELTDEGPVSRHMPSVDVLFRSVATAAGRRGVGVVLTGMGNDGANGLRAMRDAGARTFGQDAASCVVYGMPKAAMRLGAVAQEAPLGDLAHLILDACGAVPST